MQSLFRELESFGFLLRLGGNYYEKRMLWNRFIAFFCIIALMSMLSLNAIAANVESGEIELDPSSNITYEELPSDVQEMVAQGDYVYYDEDNDHYYLVPVNPLNDSSGGSTISRGTYSRPKGGTYTFSNPVIESSGYTKTYLLSVSYIPVAVVAGYLINAHDTSLMAQVKSLVMSGAVNAAVTLVTSSLGIGVAAGVLSAMVGLAAWNINYAVYNSVKEAYNRYCSNSTTGGLIVTTRCTYNAANGTSNIVTTFARWSTTIVNDTHYGMTGTWRDGIYYAGGQKVTG